MSPCTVCGGVLDHTAYSGTLCWPCAHVHAPKPGFLDFLRRHDYPRIAFIVSVVPFFVKLRFVQQTSGGDAFFFDVVPAVLGPIAILLGFYAAYRSHRDFDDVSNQAVLAILLGIVQGVRAFVPFDIPGASRLLSGI